MRTYYFKTEQILPISLEEAWRFFSSPNNLSMITPPEMEFKILTKLDDKSEIFEGMIIDYKIKPLLNIPMKWQTRIGKIIKYNEFTDTQSEGPYKMWEHLHIFNEVKGGVQMMDVVKYQLPFGILGNLANWVFVSNKIKSIFQFRREVLEETFKPYEHVAY